MGSPEGQGVIAAAITGSARALVFEAGRKADAIITRRKGTGGMTAVAHGKAAHAGNAHKEGANAIWALARFVDGVQKLTDYDRGVTVNVGRVSGGAEQEHGARPRRGPARPALLHAADGEALVERVRAAAAEAAAGVAGTRIELHGGVARMPLERTEASAALLAEYAACARATASAATRRRSSAAAATRARRAVWASHRSTAWARAAPGFHTKEELIEVASLVPKAQALARFLAPAKYA